MNKPKSSKPKTGKKVGSAPRTVEEYMVRVPEPAREVLTKMRATIRAAVPPEATEIISYGIPAFKDKKVLVWYAAFSGHCSLFPTASVIEHFKDELGAFSVSKGTIQFPLAKPLPVALIKKLVKARLADMKGSKQGSGKY